MQMNKYKLLFFMLIVFFSIHTVFCQEIDKKISMLENYLSKLDEVSLEFEQKSSKGEIKRGWMLIKKPNSIRIEYEKPHPTIIVSNQEYLILYNAEDNIITHLPITDGPWTIFTNNKIKLTSDKNNREAHGVVEDIKEINKNNKKYFFYKLLLRNNNRDLIKNGIIIHLSNDPTKIIGWTITDNNNNKIFVKIIKITDEKANPIDLEMFKLSEKDRKSGDVWKGPFNRSPANRYSTGRL